FCAASTALRGSYLASSTMSLILRPLMPPCSLISSTRNTMPRRTDLPKPASGPDRSLMEPSTISSLLTPCVWASAAPAARPSAAAKRQARDAFMACLLKGVGSVVHRFDLLGVFLLH